MNEKYNYDDSKGFEVYYELVSEADSKITKYKAVLCYQGLPVMESEAGHRTMSNASFYDFMIEKLNQPLDEQTIKELVELHKSGQHKGIVIL